MEYSETWSARRGYIDVPGLFALAGAKPFCLLYGDGPRGRWLLFAEDPLLVLDRPDPSGVEITRRGCLPPILPDFIGMISYEGGKLFEPFLSPPLPSVIAVPEFRFSLYRRLVLFDREAEIVYECLHDGPRMGSRWDGPGSHLLRTGRFAARKVWDSDDAESYADKVSAIRGEIAAGNVYQVNLTRQEAWSFEGDLRAFALDLYRANPAPFSAMIAEPDFTIVSSSPERLVRVDRGRIEARPIKGTAPRGTTERDDAALRDGLLASGKDRAELAMIVDLLRNDLTRACIVPSVRVDAFPELETYANVHHLVASVSGEARPGLSLEDLLHAVFPGGSVTGCPKLAAMRIIRSLESQPRAVYTGALGWFSRDLAQLDLNIPIRTAWADGERLLFGVGGAVVWDSDPRQEYEETVSKGRSIVRCLSS
jgi:anthranilate/para-aminobenzoate synthase component I